MFTEKFSRSMRGMSAQYWETAESNTARLDLPKVPPDFRHTPGQPVLDPTIREIARERARLVTEARDQASLYTAPPIENNHDEWVRLCRARFGAEPAVTRKIYYDRVRRGVGTARVGGVVACSETAAMVTLALVALWCVVALGTGLLITSHAFNRGKIVDALYAACILLGLWGATALLIAKVSGL
ncbi:MAG: hypothetical protein HC927_04985 [Deltaproteobacteria bacterium]|nr:hypothetical protein [Deltaproteobacteria bacterium]